MLMTSSLALHEGCVTKWMSASKHPDPRLTPESTLVCPVLAYECKVQ